MTTTDHTTTVVATIPECDLFRDHGPAYADAKIPGMGWGYVCKDCFDHYGCSLGLGQGQQLLVREDA